MYEEENGMIQLDNVTATKQLNIKVNRNDLTEDVHLKSNMQFLCYLKLNKKRQDNLMTDLMTKSWDGHSKEAGRRACFQCLSQWANPRL